MTLTEYNKKRNFNNTKEPVGKTKKQSKALKFVIQYHKARAKHYDFRLEYKGVLLSWAVPKGLSVNPKDKRLAVMVEDHPLDYAKFEGVIPKGNYGAGSVEIFDSGTYFALEDFNKGLKKGHLKFVLNGQKYKGAWSLVKIDQKNWLIVKAEDEFAQEKQNNKITKNPFNTCSVQLATLSNTIPKGKDWLFEIKYDGYRILTFAQNNKIKMLSRNNKDYTNKFKSIANSLGKLEQPFVIDGEIVVFDEQGRSDFGLLQNNIKNPSQNFYYVIFDILSLNGQDLRSLTLLNRKKKLELFLAKADKNLIFSSFVVGKGDQSFDFAKQNNLEGIVAKKIDSQYTGNRSDAWLKIKCYHRQEFVIGGFTTSDKNQILSSVLLGYYKNKKLIFVGKVGTGFSEETKSLLLKKFNKLQIKTSPFENFSKKTKHIFFKTRTCCRNSVCRTYKRQPFASA